VGFQLPEVREVKVKITRFVYFCSQKYIEGWLRFLLYFWFIATFG
jgi:hypothetical protein